MSQNGLFSKFSGKSNEPQYAIGIFDEGMFLQVVCLSKIGSTIQVVDAEVFRLASRLENVAEGQQFLFENASMMEGNGPIDLSSGFNEGEIDFGNNREEDGGGENLFLLRSILGKYIHKDYKIAVSLNEPQISYKQFESNWNLSGKDLTKRVLEELNSERTSKKSLKVNDLHIINIADGRILSVARNSDLNIVNLLTEVSSSMVRRVSFVESAESSLINLIKRNYSLREDENVLIVHVGHEFSRLIYLNGESILRISDLIEAGATNDNIGQVVYSRILYDQEHYQTANVGRIVLTGEALEADLVNFLSAKIGGGIDLEYATIPMIEGRGMHLILSRFAVSIGAALRILDEQPGSVYNVDITPERVRDRQRIFKLGLEGWILLTLVPLIAFFAAYKVSQLSSELNRLNVLSQAASSDFVESPAVEPELDKTKSVLSTYDQTLSVIDVMTANSDTWSSFLSEFTKLTRDIGGIWITEITQPAKTQIKIRGFSTHQERIPRLARALKKSVLQSVSVEEIRNKMVFNFEIEMPVPGTPEPVAPKDKKGKK